MASIKFPSNWNSRRRKDRRESFRSQDVIFSRPIIRHVESHFPVLTSRARIEDDLYLNFRLFFIFGKLIGLVPFQGLFQRDYKKLRYFHFYRNSLQLIHLIHKWNDLRLYFTKPDVHLFRDVNLVAAVVMISAILENLFVNLKYFPMGQEAEVRLQKLNRSALEEYFINCNYQWSVLVAYHHALNLFTFVNNKLALYAWNYADITIILLSRAIYFKFQALNSQGEDILFHKGAEQLKWSQFIRDYETLRKILQEVNNFLSPLIFITYGIGIYFLCLQFHNRLNPYENATPIAAIYALWSIFHLIGRILLVSISGARINDWAHQVADLLRRCPNKAYLSDVERTENFISSKIIGLTGLGCFTITKPLILNVIAVIFTFEMVLLQALQASLNKST
ncbi:unnamed protein product [Allacma fusca]|uniref:Gustatory receptor n=1 Tax=Allacma fusca TaxID=39272 RepID=A0A8J2JBL8_9HEXA|nr:unnamed protein product [Allacma fusca]